MVSIAIKVERGIWSAEEHDKFLEGLRHHPHGPWKAIAQYVGTRSARQVQTHAQKYYEKVARRLRGLRKDRKKLVRPEHRLDEDMVKLCHLAKTEGSEHVSLKKKAPSKVKQEHKMKTKETPDQHRTFVEMLLGDQSGNISDSSSNADSDDLNSHSPLSIFDENCLDYLLQVLDSNDYYSDSSSSSSQW